MSNSGYKISVFISGFITTVIQNTSVVFDYEIWKNIIECFKKIEDYLVNKRSIDKKISKVLYRSGLVYLDEKNNINFVIKDRSNKTVGEDIIGTGEKRFRRNTSEKYGFNLENNPKLTKEVVYIFEAPIDLISFLELNRKDIESRHKNQGTLFLSISGVRQDILESYLDENIKKMYICTDNDEAGHNFFKEMKEKYKDLEIKRELPEEKDWNEDLQLKKA